MPVRLHLLDPDLVGQLVQRRHALGLSQNALAMAAGLTEAALAKYETLRCPISPERRASLERALDDADAKASAAS